MGAPRRGLSSHASATTRTPSGPGSLTDSVTRGRPMLPVAPMIPGDHWVESGRPKLREKDFPMKISR